VRLREVPGRQEQALPMTSLGKLIAVVAGAAVAVVAWGWYALRGRKPEQKRDGD
jgi:hypothetical protein